MSESSLAKDWLKQEEVDTCQKRLQNLGRFPNFTLAALAARGFLNDLFNEHLEVDVSKMTGMDVMALFRAPSAQGII
jgi:hypothetical protein